MVYQNFYPNCNTHMSYLKWFSQIYILSCAFFGCFYQKISKTHLWLLLRYIRPIDTYHTSYRYAIVYVKRSTSMMYDIFNDFDGIKEDFIINQCIWTVYKDTYTTCIAFLILLSANSNLRYYLKNMLQFPLGICKISY